MTGFPLAQKVVVTRGGAVKVVVNRAKPIYSRSGIENLVMGDDFVDVVFPTPVPTTGYAIQVTLFNAADNPILTPFLNLKGYSKGQGGFRVYFSTPPTTANFQMHWSIGELYNP